MTGHGACHLEQRVVVIVGPCRHGACYLEQRVVVIVGPCGLVSINRPAQGRARLKFFVTVFHCGMCVCLNYNYTKNQLS